MHCTEYVRSKCAHQAEYARDEVALFTFPHTKNEPSSSTGLHADQRLQLTRQARRDDGVALNQKEAKVKTPEISSARFSVDSGLCIAWQARSQRPTEKL